jgi:hypothetical protein
MGPHRQRGCEPGPGVLDIVGTAEVMAVVAVQRVARRCVVDGMEVWYMQAMGKKREENEGDVDGDFGSSSKGS